MKIVEYPHEALTCVCAPLPLPLASKVKTKLAKLSKTLKRASNGLGLAAPQVGWTVRAFVATVRIGPSLRNMIFVNPNIVATDKTPLRDVEGCLSSPGVYLKITRPESISLHWIDGRTGERRSGNFSGLDARVIQHEIDHLDGMMIWDRAKMSDLDRKFSGDGWEMAKTKYGIEREQ